MQKSDRLLVDLEFHQIAMESRGIIDPSLHSSLFSRAIARIRDLEAEIEWMDRKQSHGCTDFRCKNPHG